MQTAGSSAASAPKAGFWIRFVAYFIDGLIIWIPAVILLAIFGGFSSSSSGQVSGASVVVYLLVVVASIVYFIYFWTRPAGQTLGMKMVNIRVVKTDGSPITIGTAVARFIGTILNSIIFGLPIGWVWAAFDANKQGWHDKIAGTVVIRPN